MSRFFRRTVSLLTIICFLFSNVRVYADAPAGVMLPEGGVIQAGTGAINDRVGDTLQVDQNTQRMVVDWRTFSIGAGGTVNFNQTQGASSLVLNRVTGSSSASSILGTMNAAGRVFLVNP
ncbi:MAG: filamentous hemagglutinin N-terminal domain-containing protein, partial [Candidatus Omnitrophica bacterium]|nr:filamentous hemagglutinin N-terminal domain-containing protein [Candidatus Omnitrophota bacterium]